jgi:DNA-binding GntR family transcriptional regulator
MPELLTEQIYKKIKEDILTGVYGFGEQLSVSELAEKYGVSATPVRAALNALQRENLVEVLPRVGCFVSPLSVKDVQDIFQLRAIIEGAAAEMAAQCITDEEVAYLENMPSSYIPGDVDSYWQYLGENREFHYRVALATGNRWLAEQVGRLLDQMQRLLFLRLDLHDCADEMAEGHRQLVAALKERDGALAKQVTVDAIENARKAVLEAILSGARLPIQLSE